MIMTHEFKLTPFLVKIKTQHSQWVAALEKVQFYITKNEATQKIPSPSTASWSNKFQGI